MDIRIFKTISGQEIIARLIKTENLPYTACYHVKDPLIIHVFRDQQGNPSMGFAPFSMVISDAEPVHLLESALLMSPKNPIQEIADAYVQNVTGLALPPGSASGQIVLG